ncbi:hypothetical protein, partial [Pseudomonas aeruginosa]|uniref:hypothetical protein n=1 Tax=Pseudomonas aeruginosa TaxID=287 RepID=UPI0015EBCDC8
RLLADSWGMFRLAIPPAAALIGLMLGDAYADPRKPSALKPMRGAVFGVGFAFLSQAVFSLGNRQLSLPFWIMLPGGAASLLLVSTVRMLFPPVADGPQSANGPAFWQKPEAEPLKPKMAAPPVVAYIGLLILVT